MGYYSLPNKNNQKDDDYRQDTPNKIGFHRAYVFGKWNAQNAKNPVKMIAQGLWQVNETPD